jgi:hypothetical protein
MAAAAGGEQWRLHGYGCGPPPSLPHRQRRWYGADEGLSDGRSSGSSASAANRAVPGPIGGGSTPAEWQRLQATFLPLRRRRRCGSSLDWQRADPKRRYFFCFFGNVSFRWPHQTDEKYRTFVGTDEKYGTFVRKLPSAKGPTEDNPKPTEKTFSVGFGLSSVGF